MDSASARELFDANAESYDRVNRLISMGLHARWYEWAASRAVLSAGERVLDAFAGTGGVGLRAAARGGEVTLADISQKMLAVAQENATERGLHVSTNNADLTAERVCMLGAPFDAVTLMWGLRYLDEPTRVVRNLASLLGSQGRLVIVEFVEPERISPAGFYFFRVLPVAAGLLAHRRELYRELACSTRRLGSERRLVEIVESAGLRIVERRSMGFGLVMGIVAMNPNAEQAFSPLDSADFAV